MTDQTQLSKPSFAYCDDSSRSKSHKRILLGVVLIGLGLVFLLEQGGYIESQAMAHYWPLVFALFGLDKLAFSQTNHRRLTGLFEIAASFWVFACFEHLWGWTFLVTWPIILIIFGLCRIGSALINDDNTNGNAS